MPQDGVCGMSRAAKKRAKKNSTIYYSPLSYKGYDAVIHPSILEPVIQYSLKLNARYALKEKAQEKVKHEYFFVNPEGRLQRVNLEHSHE